MSYPKKGDTCDIYSYEWSWVEPNGIERGHWHATDDTHIDIFPPSEGYDTWMVAVGDEVLIELGEEDEAAAFHYGASKRRALAN